MPTSISAADISRMAYQHAQYLEMGMKVDFRAYSKCRRCRTPSENQLTPLMCSRCHTVVYCSRECQVADWKGGDMHKNWCAANKEFMKRLPYFLSQFQQFSWAVTASDGTFPYRVVLASFGIYGAGIQFGYWSVPVGTDDGYDSRREAMKGLMLPPPEDYRHGEMVLGKEWPTEDLAWRLGPKLKSDLIPHLIFTNESLPPKPVQCGQIMDWQSWHDWRGLSMASPAVIVMHYPLTVYHLLVNVLQVVDQGIPSTERHAIQVHYLGAQRELNFLPLFSELALLLPFTDITITFFGEAVFKLVTEAKKNHPGSLATNDPVWSYTAPEETGGGSVKIKLYSKAPYWDQEVCNSGKPNAIVGLNAGLFTYDEWAFPILASLRGHIPFGVTDYDEATSQRMEEKLNEASDVIYGQTCHPGRKGIFPITVNPFHQPGQRQSGESRLPSHNNGFITAIVKRKSATCK